MCLPGLYGGMGGCFADPPQGVLLRAGSMLGKWGEEETE